MDLRIFIAVLLRFKVIIAVGTLLAITLAGLSAVKVDLRNGKPDVSYRNAETWQSSSHILLTQEGFPWGRSTLTDVVPLTANGETQYAPRFADATRFQGLALIYASLASGDEVRDALLEDGPINGGYGAQAIKSTDGSTSLPLIEISGIATSAAAASALANRVTEAFRAYIKEYQEANNVPKAQRVDLPVVKKAAGATMTKGRSMTRPMFIFLLMMTLVIGLAFVLENLRPRNWRIGTTGDDDMALATLDPELDHERATLDPELDHERLTLHSARR